MKRSNSGDFCMLYIEPLDANAAVLADIAGQASLRKPVVIMLPVTGKARAFSRPEDFNDLKHVKRENNLTVLFVIADNGANGANVYLRQLAARHGFPAYPSIDALSDAIRRGRLTFSGHGTIGSRAKTVPLNPPKPAAPPARPAISISPSTPSISSPSAPRRRRGWRGLFISLVALVIILLGGGASLGYYFVYAREAPASTPIAVPQAVGTLYFLSSEQVSETSNAGLNDEVELDLQGLMPPAPGNSLYAWLLSDRAQGDTTIVSLGKLDISQGSASLLYKGDVLHTNLLAITSRFLVTEQSAATTPVAPSPDYSTWRYYGIIPQTPNPNDTQHFSLLDHLRHLLAADPLLDTLELPGGLCSWFYRNTGKLLEWTVSARDNWEESKDIAFERRQVERVLSYLDGLSFVTQDLPAGVTLPGTDNLASVGLIDVQGANQQPPSYVTHILKHLNGLINSPGATPQLRQSAAQIIAAMSNVQQWFSAMRSDALQLLNLGDAQMLQPNALVLLNDLVARTNAAFSGQIDPVTGNMRLGVIWIDAHIQSLATISIYRYIAPEQTPEIVPNTQPFT